MGTTKEKRSTERNFHAKLEAGGVAPEDVVIQIMNGKGSIQHDGKQVKISDKMYQAALALLPYRLPKLNSIDAEVKNVELTHDEWIASLDQTED